MEWVETTAKTLDEAKDLALDRLGVAADDAEFEVLEEPRKWAVRAHARRSQGAGASDAGGRAAQAGASQPRPEPSEERFGLEQPESQHSGWAQSGRERCRQRT